MTKDQQAKYLAEQHSSIEPMMFAVYRIRSRSREADPREPVKLLEVNDGTVQEGIRPVYFGADPDNELCFPTAIVEITPDEFRMLEHGELTLPDDWVLADLLNGPRQRMAQ